MSNRTEADITYAAELKAAHIAQIEALTAPGLSDSERLTRFSQAARFDAKWTEEVAVAFHSQRTHSFDVAYVCWTVGQAPYSLFADLPGCSCPVIEVDMGHAKFDGIPARIPFDWQPTAEMLEAFARVQQERRLGHGS
jgi:hypothetical protein